MIFLSCKLSQFSEKVLGSRGEHVRRLLNEQWDSSRSKQSKFTNDLSSVLIVGLIWLCAVLWIAQMFECELISVTVALEISRFFTVWHTWCKLPVKLLSVSLFVYLLVNRITWIVLERFPWNLVWLWTARLRRIHWKLVDWLPFWIFEAWHLTSNVYIYACMYEGNSRLLLAWLS